MGINKLWALVQFRLGSHALPVEHGRFARPAVPRHPFWCQSWLRKPDRVTPRFPVDHLSKSLTAMLEMARGGFQGARSMSSAADDLAIHMAPEQ